MRLIDADVENERLLDFIAQNDSGIKYAIEHKDITMLEEIFFDYFETQKTAYDLESVIVQLEEKILEIKKKLMNCFDGHHAVRLRVKMSAYEEIKEIIKSECINATDRKDPKKE